MHKINIQRKFNYKYNKFKKRLIGNFIVIISRCRNAIFIQNMFCQIYINILCFNWFRPRELWNRRSSIVARFQQYEQKCNRWLRQRNNDLLVLLYGKDLWEDVFFVAFTKLLISEHIHVRIHKSQCLLITSAQGLSKTVP